jgi:hypothetical protein
MANYDDLRGAAERTFGRDVVRKVEEEVKNKATSGKDKTDYIVSAEHVVFNEEPTRSRDKPP